MSCFETPNVAGCIELASIDVSYEQPSCIFCLSLLNLTFSAILAEFNCFSVALFFDHLSLTGQYLYIKLMLLHAHFEAFQDTLGVVFAVLLYCLRYWFVHFLDQLELLRLHMTILLLLHPRHPEIATSQHAAGCALFMHLFFLKF